MAFKTRIGKHGTQTRYEVTYDVGDPGSPHLKWRCWAYSREHAVDQFEDGGGDYDVVSVKEVRA